MDSTGVSTDGTYRTTSFRKPSDCVPRWLSTSSWQRTKPGYGGLTSRSRFHGSDASDGLSSDTDSMSVMVPSMPQRAGQTELSRSQQVGSKWNSSLQIPAGRESFGFEFGFEFGFAFGFEFGFAFGFEFGFAFGSAFGFEFEFQFESGLGVGRADSVSRRGSSRDSRSDAEKTNGKLSPTLEPTSRRYACGSAARAAPPFCSSRRPESRPPGRAAAPIPPRPGCSSRSRDG